mmetsp:Transcript_15190/g.21496  ORF Transcript_15190/g.21496 Transcript_15190/m.21496 type:complete len:104 (+) Transcript_15190:706-1017(+)
MVNAFKFSDRDDKHVLSVVTSQSPATHDKPSQQSLGMTHLSNSLAQSAATMESFKQIQTRIKKGGKLPRNFMLEEELLKSYVLWLIVGLVVLVFYVGMCVKNR